MKKYATSLKRLLAVLLILATLCTVLASCKGDDEGNESDTDYGSDVATDENGETLSGSDSSSGDGEDGEVTVNAKAFVKGSKVAEKNNNSADLRFGFTTVKTADGKIVAAVVIDSANKVTLVKIDEIANGYSQSKKELGDSYGMLGNPYGSSLAEWHDQIAHLEANLVGKTAEEIAGISAGDADITAGCTVYIGNYTQAVINAINAAKSATSFDAVAKNVDISLSFTVSGDSFTVNASTTNA